MLVLCAVYIIDFLSLHLFPLLLCTVCSSAVYSCPVYLTQPLLKPRRPSPVLAVLAASPFYSPLYPTYKHFLFTFFSFHLPRCCGKNSQTKYSLIRMRFFMSFFLFCLVYLNKTKTLCSLRKNYDFLCVFIMTSRMG